MSSNHIKKILILELVPLVLLAIINSLIVSWIVAPVLGMSFWDGQAVAMAAQLTIAGSIVLAKLI